LPIFDRQACGFAKGRIWFDKLKIGQTNPKNAELTYIPSVLAEKGLRQISPPH